MRKKIIYLTGTKETLKIGMALVAAVNKLTVFNSASLPKWALLRAFHL